eukprot:TRINITY_DN9018_c0_g1_i1.p1 TRINITY_DN9018_c0_g1~~TRINITY_DN9018_c0_g1_i1.p1  ORF type:complete len:237 (+),score=47.41 TRINITY_DN9018_c0_g1_i1:1318-2028(+)
MVRVRNRECHLFCPPPPFQVCSYNSKNLMTPSCMAAIFGPLLLRPQIEIQDSGKIGTLDSVVVFVQMMIEKPGKILADENMNGFIATFTITPHLPPEPIQQVTPPDNTKTLNRRRVGKSSSTGGATQKKILSGSPSKDRSSSVLPPVAYSFQASPDERTEITKLFEYMQLESKTSSHAKALLAYKEMILNIKLAARCAKCGNISAEVDPSFCATCGSNLKGYEYTLDNLSVTEDVQ